MFTPESRRLGVLFQYNSVVAEAVVNSYLTSTPSVETYDIVDVSYSFFLRMPLHSLDLRRVVFQPSGGAKQVGHGHREAGDVGVTGDHLGFFQHQP